MSGHGSTRDAFPGGTGGFLMTGVVVGMSGHGSRRAAFPGGTGRFLVTGFVGR